MDYLLDAPASSPYAIACEMQDAGSTARAILDQIEIILAEPSLEALRPAYAERAEAMEARVLAALDDLRRYGPDEAGAIYDLALEWAPIDAAYAADVEALYAAQDAEAGAEAGV